MSLEEGGDIVHPFDQDEVVHVRLQINWWSCHRNERLHRCVSNIKKKISGEIKSTEKLMDLATSMRFVHYYIESYVGAHKLHLQYNHFATEGADPGN